MSSIFDTMFIKRFCLPCDVDITSDNLKNTHISSCLCGNYNHACCLLQGKKRHFEKG